MQPLVVPGNLESLQAIRDYVMAAAAEAGLDRRKTNRLRLAVDEITTNSIVHGYDEAGLEGDLRVEAQLDDQRLTILIEDRGAAYDATQHRIPSFEELTAPLDSREIGGLGIFLTLKGMDDFRYERVGNRNRNIFIMNRGTE
ncbi:MAG: anti-sigma regulatory factor [Anaerolineae bacterium]|nr:anti-sigma regulatory factor [Anaerolineae bacterium]